MPLPSFLQRFRPDGAPGAVSDAVSSLDVEAARVRARRRLIGMVVLVGAGVIGFPLLFETQPRPLSPDVQIVQAPGARGEAVVPGATGGRVAGGKVTVATGAPAKVDPAPAARPAVAAVVPPAEVIDEAPEPASAPDKVASKPAKTELAVKPAAKPAVKETARPFAKETAKEAPKEPARSKDAGKSKDPAKDAVKETVKESAKDKAATRYVVQFGAFADTATAHEARMKVERLGLKTYTQQVDTPAGKRIRVRMGPYADKAEADKAMGVLRKAGLSGAVLTL